MFKVMDLAMNTKSEKLARVKRCLDNGILYWYYGDTPNNIHVTLLPSDRIALIEKFNLSDNIIKENK